MTTWILVLAVFGAPGDIRSAKLPGYASERECMEGGAQAGRQQSALLQSLREGLDKPYSEIRIFEYRCVKDVKE